MPRPASLLAAALALLALGAPALAQQTPQVSAKSTHVLALDADGRVYAWGADSYGQLGAGRTVFVPFPSMVRDLPAIATFSVSNDHVAAVDTAGFVWTWGASSSGKLGSRPGKAANEPGLVEGISGVVEVAAGATFTLARKANGTVWGWGYIPGVGTAAQPTKLLGIPAATLLAAGDQHFLARLADGRVWVAGANNEGQLGLGNTAGPNAGQIHPTLAGVARVAAMGDTSAALVGGSPNLPLAWGFGFAQRVPVAPTGQFPPGANFGDIAVQGRFPTVLLTNGDVWQWTEGPVDSAHPGGAVPVGGTAGVWNLGGTRPMWGLGTGRNTVYGWDTSFSLYSFGANGSGELGTNSLDSAYAAPVAVPNDKFQLVRGGFSFAAGLKSNGELWVWGDNSSGQLANARFHLCGFLGSVICPSPDPEIIANKLDLFSTLPVQSLVGTSVIAQVSAGWGFSLARTTGGAVLAWGNGSSGQLGMGNYASMSRPRTIPGLTNVTDIAAGVGHALFRKGDGTVWETGGLPNISSLTNVPRQVAMPEAISRVFTGDGSAFAVTASGRVYAWGVNFSGQLGLGDTTTRASPTLVPGTGTGNLVVREISAAGPGLHALARMANGTVYAWGRNDYGMLGDGTVTQRLSPVQVPGITNAVSVAAGLYFSLVALTDGTIRSFGRNDAGQLGDGTNINRLSPAIVTDLSVTSSDPDPTRRASIVQVTAGNATAMALRTGGTLFSWGTSGTSPAQTVQEIETLGDGKLVPRNRPGIVLSHDSTANLDGGDWYLDLDVPTADARPAFTNRKIVPVVKAVVSSTEISLAASINFRFADYGKKVGTYVMGLVPPAFLNAAKVAPGTSLVKAMKSGEMVLVMLTPAGWTTVTGQLVAFTTSVINANGGANNILNGIPTSAMTGAKFCVGYGADAGNMVSDETLSEVLALPGAGGNVGGIPCLVSGAYVSGPAASNAGTPVTFKATVIGTSPTGKVFFRDSAATISPLIDIAFPPANPGNETVANASFTTSTLAAGLHSIAVTYQGDAQNPATDTAYGLTHAVSPATTGSAVYLTGPPNSSLGQPVTFRAVLTGNNPTGEVQFRDGATNLGSPQPIVDSVAMLTVNTLGTGTHTITANYPGDVGTGGVNTGSTSGAVTHTVYETIVAAISLAASANPATVGVPVTLTATVTGPGALSGTVTFRDSGSLSLETPLVSGQAQFVASYLAGVHSLTADYVPDAGAIAAGNTAASSATYFLAVEVALDPAADPDADGIPNGVERTEGTSPYAKDNDVFSATPSSARLFSMQQYRDFLGREGDAPGVAAWAGYVTAGTFTRAQVIDAFVNSPEFGGFVAPVVRLYFATFLRVPDYNGLIVNAGLVRNGTVTLTQLADFFTTSPEFVATYGSLSNTAFVTLLYQNVLGRAPDSGGLSAWVALLNGGMSRGQVLLGFSDSPEYQAAMANEVLVTMMYAGMLRRTPETAGFNAWVAILDAGTLTREQVINGFFLSAEYRTRFLP